MKYIDCFIIYAIIQYFKQIAGVVESKNNIFISIIIQRPLIFGPLKSTAYSFLADTMPESCTVKLYIFPHILKIYCLFKVRTRIFQAFGFNLTLGVFRSLTDYSFADGILLFANGILAICFSHHSPRP